ncbi:HGL193Cp [Eremothecium sinecaudum]|uniref:HGL193Cp n=1 Tax=Eremothecium sinecaudum TaxID=45286 RepID=A0A0X8HV81_9SACH|nr:HGL193Cp [Eremothecium sinecaudum]AMD22147.1 HGL193Cp [Eremothecium sinecaudum]
MFNFRQQVRRILLDWTVFVSLHPKLCIACPLLLLVFAFPNLKVYGGSGVGDNGFNGYVSSVGLKYVETAKANASFTQILIQPNDEANVLNKRFLMECYALQQRILKDLGPEHVFSVHSPFEAWENDERRLASDQMPIYTINESPRMLQGLLQGVTQLNGYIMSARSLAIMILTMREQTAHTVGILAENLKALKSVSEVTRYYIYGGNAMWDTPQELVQFLLVRMTKWDYAILLVMYLAISAYYTYTTFSVRHLKSRFGVFIAGICQMVLVLGTARTITELLFKGSNDNVPWCLLYVPIMIVAVSTFADLNKSTNGTTMCTSPEYEMVDMQAANMANGIGASPISPSLSSGPTSSKDSSSYQENFFESVSRSHFKCLISGLLSIAAVMFLFPFSGKTTCFLVSSLICNAFMATTFFTAILSLDHRRFNMKDLLFMKDSDENFDVSLDKDFKAMGFCKWICFLINTTPVLKVLWVSRSLIFVSLYMILFNLRFAYVRSSSSLLYKIYTGGFFKLMDSTRRYPTAVFDLSLITHEIVKLLESNNKNQISYTVMIEKPILIMKDVLDKHELYGRNFTEVLRLFNSSMFSSYKFDGYYLSNFLVCLVLVAASTLLILQQLAEKADLQNPVQLSSPWSASFFSSCSGFSTRATTRNNSLAPNTALLNTFPRNDPSDGIGRSCFRTKELAEHGHSLDITYIATSQSPFIVSVGMDYKIFVWSPLARPMVKPTPIPLDRRFWPISHVTISNNGSFIAFFNRVGKVTCWSRTLMNFLWTLKLNSATPLEAFFRTRTVPSILKRKIVRKPSDSSILSSSTGKGSVRNVPLTRQNSIKSMTSMGTTSGVDSCYENPSAPYSSAEQIGEEEFVFVTSNGDLCVVDMEGNIKIEKLTPSSEPLVSCKKLISPRISDRIISCNVKGELFVSTVLNNKWRTKKLSIQKNAFNVITPENFKYGLSIASRLDNSHDEALDPLPSPQENPNLDSDNKLLMVHFVGFIGRTNGNKLEFIDAQTGTFIRHFTLGSFIPNSLKIFHDMPTHCRFCGSASVASFSIAYSEPGSHTLVMHTYQLASKTKNSICLRVDRDPREVRCLGLESVTEKKHYLPNVENWNVTENNMIIGINRKSESINDLKSGGSTSMCRRPLEPHANNLQNRKAGSKNKEVHRHEMVYNIHNIWEGWTMNVNGNVEFHEIPIGLNGLMVNKIVNMEKFGAKSIVVAFGNIMKLFYLGKEELILTADCAGSNGENTGLRFINKRRDRLNNKKAYVSTIYSNLIPED